MRRGAVARDVEVIGASFLSASVGGVRTGIAIVGPLECAFVVGPIRCDTRVLLLRYVNVCCRITKLDKTYRDYLYGTLRLLRHESELAASR